MRLLGKVALITGGGSGIGAAIAKKFASQGAKVVICGRRSQILDLTAKQITSNRGEVMCSVADVSDEAQVNEMVKKIIAKYGSIDILVNNAGVYVAGDVVNTPMLHWDQVMQIDLKGVYLVCKAVLPHMLKKKFGKIINVASIAGVVGFSSSAAYCSAKAAVINLTREMALDYAKEGVNVNAIAPGVVETDMTKSILQDSKSKEVFINNTPVGRVGKPDDIANGAMFLATDDSSFIVGQTLVIDGGWTIK